jgi:hypothetical protein
MRVRANFFLSDFFLVNEKKNAEIGQNLAYFAAIAWSEF